MSWPTWPSFEFPPKELPVFLHPLRLIPYYKNRIGTALTSFVRRDDNRLFGPVEQAVTAIVVIGLALQSGSTADSAAPMPVHTSPRSSTSLPQNDTSPSLLSHGSAHLPILVSPSLSTGSTTFDILIGFLFWLKDQLSMSTVLIVLLALNAGLMMLPNELKSRLKTSWNLFWPSWQDRSTDPEPDKLSSADLPGSTRAKSHSQDTMSGHSRSRDLPAIKEDPQVAKPPQSESRKMAADSNDARTASRSLSKGKERMEGERPADETSASGTTEKPAKDETRAQATAGQDEVRKQLDKVRAKMLAIKQDVGLEQSAKAAKLKELEATKEKLKVKLSDPAPPKTPSSTKTPENKQGDPKAGTRPVAPVTESAEQLAKLKQKMKTIQEDTSLDQAQKDSQLKKLEAMRQALKVKSATATSNSTSSPAGESKETKTPESTLGDQLAPANSSDDQKQLEKLKAQMMVVKADKSLSDSDRAAKLGQLDQARQQLKRRIQASPDNSQKGREQVLSTELTTPNTPAPVAGRAVDLSPETQKQLERLKGKMAAVKADKTLTESERASKMRELDKARQKLKGDQPGMRDALSEKEPSKSSGTIADPEVPKQKPSKSASAESSGASGGDTDTARSTITDDPLLSGESRQLKSALKKSKKKSRQKKNIHHNYFMTMRGWRPALAPFPHGLHPKPQHPRHTLWWDNVPKDADHIMASQKIAKVPEGLRPGEDDSGEEGKKEKKGDKAADGEGKKVLEKVDKKIPPAEAEETRTKGSSASSKADKAGEGDNRSSSKKADDKGEDAEKMKAAAKAKEQAKAQEEAKAKSKSSERAPAARGAPLVSGVSIPPPIDPQVQKATWVAQGMLCALIWFVHEQLALVLVGFFVWQHMQDFKTHAASLAALQAAATTTTDRTARADDRAKPPTSEPAKDATREGKSAAAGAKADTKVAPAAESRATEASKDIVKARTRSGVVEINPESTNRKDDVVSEAKADKYPSQSLNSGRRTREDEAMSRSDIGTSGTRGTTAGAKDSHPPSQFVGRPDIAGSNIPGTADVTTPGQKRRVDKDVKAEPHSGQPVQGDPASPGDNKVRKTIDADHTVAPAQHRIDEKAKRKAAGAPATEASRFAALSPDMIKKLERVPPEKRDKYAKMLLAESQKETQGGTLSGRRASAETDSVRQAGPVSKIGREEGGLRRDHNEKDELTISKAKEKNKLPGESATKLQTNRQNKAIVDSKVPQRRQTDAREDLGVNRGPVHEKGPNSVSESKEVNRQAVERAKAVRREQRLGHTREPKNTITSEKSKNQKSKNPKPKEAVREVAPQILLPDARNSEALDGTADTAEANDSRLDPRVTTKERKLKSAAEKAPQSSLLVKVEELPEWTKRTEEPMMSQSAKAELAEPESDTGGRRDDIEKLKEARRNRLLAEHSRINILPDETDQDRIVEEASPVSVYSQMTASAPSPKASHRLTRDVDAARNALLVDAPAAGRSRRSSSTSSLEVIRFDDDKASRAKIPEEPHSAPFVRQDRHYEKTDVKDGPDAVRRGLVQREEHKKNRPETAEIHVPPPERPTSTDARRFETPNGEAKDKGKAKSSSLSVAGRDLHGGGKASQSAKDGERRDKLSRPTGERSGKSVRRARETGYDEMAGPNKRLEGRAETAKEGSNTSRSHSAKPKADRKLRLEDLTLEQVEKMQKAREKRRLEKARAAKEALGQGSSGLTLDEKASLPSP